MDKQFTNEESALGLIQKRFSIIDLKGEIRFVDEEQVEKIKSGQIQGSVSLYTKQNFKVIFDRYIENLPITDKASKLLTDFTNDPNTTMYKHMEFFPMPANSETLNLWVEPNIQPCSGSFSSIKDFLHNIICSGDDVTYDYLIKFIAHMVQKPEEKPGVMIVALGDEGTGKGTLFTLLRTIWTSTTALTANIDNITGRFNGLLANNYIVCLDEAVFVGNRKSQDNLKSLITEPTIMIEEKNQPCRTIKSCHRFFAASNQEHFSSIKRGDRRHFFLSVSSDQKGNQVYWDAFYKNTPNEIGAFLNHLQTLDISKFNPRVLIKTDEHIKQRLASLSGFHRYWYECLSQGRLIDECSGIEWDDSSFISTDKLIKGYASFDRYASRYSRVISQDISNYMTGLCPTAKKGRKKECRGFLRGYRLPSLTDARQEFERYFGVDVDWGDEDEEEQNLSVVTRVATG
jgi:hypothetical protein